MDRYQHGQVTRVSLHPDSITSRYMDVRTMTKRQLACTYASLTRSRLEDDPDLAAVRSALAEHRIRDRITADASLLSFEVRAALAQQLLTLGRAA